MYAPTIGRFINEDPIGLDGGDENYYRYVRNDPINRVDPSGLGPQWHHLLPQQKELKEVFEGLGFSIHDAQWGWILEQEDHAKVHGDWNGDWTTWLDDQKRNKFPITKETVQEQLRKMTTVNPQTPEEKLYFKKYNKYLKKGYPADIDYLSWGNLDPTGKTKHFRNLKRTMLGLLALLATFLGGADDACAAFGPVTGFTDEVWLKEFHLIAAAMREGRLLEAERSLFGREDRCDLYAENPDGLFCKMMKKQLDANPLIFNRLQDVEDAARERWQKIITGIGKDAHSQAPSCTTCPVVEVI